MRGVRISGLYEARSSLRGALVHDQAARIDLGEAVFDFSSQSTHFVFLQILSSVTINGPADDMIKSLSAHTRASTRSGEPSPQ